jgi:hypothetical protein
MLFAFSQKKGVFIYPQALKLTNKLKKMSAEQQMFIMAAYDYNSPFHQHPEDERIRMAASTYLKGTKDPLAIKGMEAAIEEYCALQYDPKRETIRNYNNKIASLNKILIKSNIPKDIVELDKAIEMLLKRQRDLQSEIDKSLDVVEIKGQGSLSTVEMFQRRMEEYHKRKTEELNRVQPIDI